METVGWSQYIKGISPGMEDLRCRCAMSPMENSQLLRVCFSPRWFRSGLQKPFAGGQSWSETESALLHCILVSWCLPLCARCWYPLCRKPTYASHAPIFRLAFSSNWVIATQGIAGLPLPPPAPPSQAARAVTAARAAMAPTATSKAMSAAPRTWTPPSHWASHGGVLSVVMPWTPLRLQLVGRQ